MPRARCFQSDWRVNPIVVMLALLGMVTMPVDYRAGATVSHPHSILHFIGDVARGSLNHHDHTHHSNSTPAAEVTLTSHVWPSNQLVAYDTTLPPLNILATIGSMSPALDIAADVDEPTVSPRSGGGAQVAYSVLLPAAALIQFQWFVRHLIWATAPDWNGITSLPEIPPPRPA